MSDKIIKNPHDHFFKLMMLDNKVIKEFFECHLPTHIKSIINLDKIKSEKDSFISDELDERLSDMLVSVKFNGEPGYIYILIEHQTKQEKLMPFRILKYMMNIFEYHLKITKKEKLPIVYPMLFYSGFKPHKYSTCFFDLFDDNKLAKDILSNPYQLVDLSKIPDEELMQQPWFGIFASVMKHSHDRKVVKYLEQITKELQPMTNFGGGIDFIYRVLRYIISTYDVVKQDFVKTVRINLPFVDEEKVMTMLEQSKQEGMQLGRQEGMRIGEHKGEQKALKIVASNLLKQRMAKDKVASCTGLSISDVEKLKKKLATAS